MFCRTMRDSATCMRSRKYVHIESFLLPSVDTSRLDIATVLHLKRESSPPATIRQGYREIPKTCDNRIHQPWQQIDNWLASIVPCWSLTSSSGFGVGDSRASKMYQREHLPTPWRCSNGSSADDSNSVFCSHDWKPNLIRRLPSIRWSRLVAPNIPRFGEVGAAYHCNCYDSYLIAVCRWSLAASHGDVVLEIVCLKHLKQNIT